ncbi:HEAT repeat domain-containing protein [Brunnivagina elsteri]|uniref:NTPase n=1 Tax=Brunnivagina elsteri CCALA 953 TaxID=987040 RepID=A0A2A2TP88_9CYAN|nr:HEAT repeat domain-containing protein [Calothrix elsteri]PAX60174.1 NTPase [Calothrix elsteri CCALA 953]
MEWLAVWGIQTAVGFLFTPVMQKFAEDLSKDLLKDILKDVIKGLPGNILQSLKKEDIDIAVGKAIAEFLKILQHELIAADLSDDDVKQYNSSLTKFLRIDEVQDILGSAFDPECESIDTQRLEKIWYDQNLLAFPADFDWKRLNKPYIKKVKAIIRESDELRNVFDSHQIEKTAKNTQELVGVPIDFDLRCYQESIRQNYGRLNYGRLKLDSLDASGSAYNELRLQQVFIPQNVRECVEILPHVFERSKEYQKYLQETGKETENVDIKELERYQKSYIEAPIRSVIDIINEKLNRNYLVILGDPGAGKSTLLQFLTLNWAESKLTNYFNQAIPILIELRTYARQFNENRCNNFLGYLHDVSGRICHLNQLKLHDELKKGNALVMFDGLDEVFNPTQREDIINDIIRFTDEYPDVQVIVTSRVIGYKDERFRNSKFRHLMLQDFDDEQIQDFINRWHQLTFNDKTDAADKKARLERGIERSKAIKELAGNPLLLTMMAILNRHRELPRDRSTLYEKASEVLLQQWDAERNLTNVKMSRFSIDLNDKQAMLREVAYHMQANEKGLTGNLINGNDLQQIFQGYLETIGNTKLDAREAAKVLIEELRQRNFILCHAGDNYYAFVHRTFLEYFCAEAFRELFESKKELTLEQLKTEVFGQHWHDESWHEVLRLIAGVINVKFVAEIIDYLMGIDGEGKKFSNLFLAAGCLAEVRERKNRDIYAQDRKLFAVINNLTGYGFYRDDIDIVTYSEDDSDEVHEYDDNKKVTEIRTLAVTTIVTTWNDDPDTLPWLKQLAQTDDDSSVQRAAVQEFARNYKDNPDTLSWLKQFAQTDDNFYDNHAIFDFSFYKNNFPVRRVAVEELARIKDDPDILPWLKQCAQTGHNWNVRRTAVKELARNYKDDPDTLPILKQIAQTDDDESVRGAAVEELARNFKDDPDTLPILKQRAQTDDDESVRRAAVEELARNYKNEAGILELFCHVAINDPFPTSSDEFLRHFKTNPRQTALELILKHYPKHPQVLSLLRDRTQNDPDEKLREWAKKQLQRLEAKN